MVVVHVIVLLLVVVAVDSGLLQQATAAAAAVVVNDGSIGNGNGISIGSNGILECILLYLEDHPCVLIFGSLLALIVGITILTTTHRHQHDNNGNNGNHRHSYCTSVWRQILYVQMRTTALPSSHSIHAD